jgi:hypothetical protein
MMSVLVIVGLFFVFGITVGVIAVIAMSALRRYKWNGSSAWSDPADLDERAADLDKDSSAADEHPWWKARDGE